MKLFGREISLSVTKAIPQTLSPIYSNQGWSRILESYPGAWQQNVVVNQETVSAYWAVFSCTTLIASDIAKLPARVQQYDAVERIWKPTLVRPVLQKPNSYQTSIDFFFSWIVSQLRHGNTYILKRRNREGFIDALYPLDPLRVKPMVSDDGSVFYELWSDSLAELVPDRTVTVPASEIIHDRMYCLHHPLIGVSPIYACGIAAMQGSAIQANSEQFFANMSRPSGILTAPGEISDETATRLKEYWTTAFSGANVGKVAVLGDALKYEAMTISAVDSQLIEQLKMTGEMICACFHVPPYKLGLGQMPTVNNTAALNQQYYEQCLQYLIEKMEARLDEGLELTFPQQTWMDLEPLLRMDPTAQVDSLVKKMGAGLISPDEGRRTMEMPPVAGGDTPYLQQQNWSLRALSNRDRKDIEGKGNVQTEAMSGGQVSSLQELVRAATAGEIPPESARAAIAVAFPLLTPAQVAAMIDPLATFKPEPEEEPVIPDEEDDDARQLAYTSALLRELDFATA